jgi:integrase/recombinase XerD
VSHHLTFSQILDGYRLYMAARHLSTHTIADYENTFRKLTAWLPTDQPFAAITVTQLNTFLSEQTVGKKTVLNYHIGLSALWHWAVDTKLAPDNLMHQVPAPKPEQHQINEFSEADLQALVRACGRSKTYRNHTKIADNALKDGDRNYAMLLLLLDTGMRVSELTGAKIHDIDVKNGRITITGKGSKTRTLPFSPRTAQAIWRYLANFRKDARLNEPLFATENDRPIDRTQVGRMLSRLGVRAGVKDCHPHRFRHTFAISYLRNGGDAYSLQMILGHADFEMVRHYINLAGSDLDAAHRRASPVDRWRL